MKGDYSKIPFNDKKRNQHYRKAYLQQGKVLLDSDLNENTDLLQYQMKNLTKDALCGSPNIGFRIGKGVPLLPVDDHRYIDERKGWSVDNGILTIDYLVKFEGKGSLKLENATSITEISFEFQKLDLSNYRYLRLILKSTLQNPDYSGLILNLFMGDNSNPIPLSPDQEYSNVQNEFSVIKYVLPLNGDLHDIRKISFLEGFASDTTYHIGAVECSPPMYVLDPMIKLREWNFEPKESAEISIDTQNGGRIKINKTTGLYKKISPINFNNYETLVFAIECTGSNNIRFYVKDSKNIEAYWDIEVLENTPEKHEINIHENQEIDLTSIKEYGFYNLTKDLTYYLGSIFFNMSLTNNFVIAGSDLLSGKTGCIYVDGEMYELEESETYLNQKEYPIAPPIQSPDKDKVRCDLVYADVWQRHMTSMEDPELREAAIGVDTCNRIKAVAQVKLIEGESVDLEGEPQAPILDKKYTGEGKLSTIVENMQSEMPCKIAPGVEYANLENRLYRVEIHTPGETATYKWSENNGTTVTPIIENARAGVSSVRVKDIRLFNAGDIIEITDDLVELADREDYSESLIKPWGELRKIKEIDTNNNKLIWSDEASAGQLQTTGMLTRDFIAEGTKTTHPKVRKWDGANTIPDENIDLGDGVKIRFSGKNMLAGDWWAFTARERTREIERLDNEPPYGVVHRYYPIAVIEWENGDIKNIEDMRARFERLCAITAADIAFDRTSKKIFGEEVQNVQQAIESKISPEDLEVSSLILKCEKADSSKWPMLKCWNEGIGFLIGDQSNGEPKLGIGADGNIGIGTRSPATRLDAAGTIRSTAQTIPTDGEGLEMIYDAENGYLKSISRSPDVYKPLHIDGSTLSLNSYSEGNVGIGTYIPNNKLNVQADSNELTAAQLEIGPVGGGSSTSSLVSKLRFRSTFDIYEIDQYPRVSAQIVSGFAGGVWGKEYLSFQVGNDGAANDGFHDPMEKMRILGNGNVGIGTPSPTRPLEIQSTMPDHHLCIGSVSPSVLLGNNAEWKSATANAILALATLNDHYGLRAGDVLVAAYGKARGNLYINSNYEGDRTTNVILQPYRGNVGIGTIEPKQKLDVQGGYVIVSDDVGSVSTTKAFIQGSKDVSYFGSLDGQRACFGNKDKWDTLTVDGGNVGIGTAPSSGAKLDVNGNILTSLLNFKGAGGNSNQPHNHYGIYQELGDWVGPFPDLVINYHTGIKYVGYYGYGGHRFYTGYSPDATPTTEAFSIGNGDHNTRVNYDLYVSGKVGIGTPGPDRSLTIANTSGANYMNVKDGTREILMGVDGSGGGIVSVMSNHDLILRAGGNSDKMRISASGNVGIGTAYPTGHQLDVASYQGSGGNSAIRALFPGGGGLLNTEFAALAHRGGAWTALYAKQGAANSAAYFDGNVGIHGNLEIQGRITGAMDTIISSDGRFKLVMQSDANLVLYRISDGKALWASGTNY